MSIVTFAENYAIGLANTLFNGFEEEISKEDTKEIVPVTWTYLQPKSEWSEKSATDGDKYKNHQVVDLTTNDQYLKESDNTIRLKCAALLAAMPFQFCGCWMNMTNKGVKVISFAHFWHTAHKDLSRDEKMEKWLGDLKKMGLAIPVTIGMGLAAAYGIYSPKDGRKIYAALERFQYSGGYQKFSYVHAKRKYLHTCLLAPCFQPRAKAHLGGSDISKQDGW